MRNWIITLCMGAALATSAHAQSASGQLMTAPEMIRAAQAVKNEKTQPLLERWVRVCLKKEWGNCQIAWWNMTQKGGLTQIEGEGFNGWGFLNQPDANQVLMHMVTGLDNPTYRPSWDMEITTSKQYADIPNIVAGRNALTDGVDQQFAVAIVQERFTQRGVMYDVRDEFAEPPLEWLRLVSLMYAVRDDAASSYQVLAELQKHANINAEAATVYNNTVKAVQEYIKKRPAK